MVTGKSKKMLSQKNMPLRSTPLAKGTLEVKEAKAEENDTRASHAAAKDLGNRLAKGPSLGQSSPNCFTYCHLREVAKVDKRLHRHSHATSVEEADTLPATASPRWKCARAATVASRVTWTPIAESRKRSASLNKSQR